jgi:PAS domain S-box-containing protein
MPPGVRELISRRNAVSWLVLALALLIGVMVLRYMHATERRAVEAQFQLLAENVSATIARRLANHEQILLGGLGLFNASGEVSRGEWRSYVETLNLGERYPGIQGVGFAQAVRPAELAAHTARVQSEGFPAYEVRPAGERALYAPIIYLEPFIDRNLAAFGYDMYSDPVRRQAMRKAAETGRAQLTGKVVLVQETHGPVQPGLLMYIAAYHDGAPLDTPEQRMAALRGFVYSPYRVVDLMRGILGTIDLQLALRIYAGSGEGIGDLLFQTGHSNGGAAASAYSTLTELPLYGQTWTLRMDSLPEFEALYGSNYALFAAIGLILSLLLFFFTSSLALRKSRAESLNAQMAERLRKSKHALLLSEERLSLALKGSNDGVWDMNLEEGSFYASQRAWQMLGYRPNDQQADLRAWERVLVEQDLAGARLKLAQTMLSATDHFTTELRFQHKLGHIVPALVRGYIQRDPDGKPLRISGTIMDLTEQKRIEQSRDEFVSTVSHELRTPLTSISGALGLINGGALGEVPETMRQMLEIAHRNSLRLGYLINDLLDMEKIALGKMSFELREHSLPRLLEEALASNQAFAAHLGVRCELGEVPEVNVWVDGLRLHQVLNNFLSNAIKYTPQRGLVSVQCALSDATHVRISVTDQGPGIPESFRSRVFERFAQADVGNARAKEGSGLGLAITKEFIERMGGTVGFESPASGGTTFWCELPILENQTAADHPERPRLLVVEDEPDTGRLLLLMLRDAGFAVDRVQSLHMAREKLRCVKYQAMTLDMHLPDGSGRQLIDEVRSDPATCELPIIVISAASHFDERSGDRGVTWLHKPVSAAQLLVALTRTLDAAKD